MTERIQMVLPDHRTRWVHPEELEAYRRAGWQPLKAAEPEVTAILRPPNNALEQSQQTNKENE